MGVSSRPNFRAGKQTSKIPFLGLSLLLNLTETLATQASLEQVTLQQYPTWMRGNFGIKVINWIWCIGSIAYFRHPNVYEKLLFDGCCAVPIQYQTNYCSDNANIGT